MATHGGISIRIESTTDRVPDIRSGLLNRHPAEETADKTGPSEHICGDGGLPVAIGGGDHPNIGANRSSSPDALKFVFLQHSQ